MAALMPPDLRQYPAYLEFRNGASEDPPPQLLRELETRLTWQATCEFGLMQLRGRTLDTNMCSAPAWDEERITATVAEILDRREKFDRELLTSIPESQWRVWHYGLLHHHRLRGAMEHPYVDLYVRVGAGWGKTGFRRKLIPGRQTHPPTGRDGISRTRANVCVIGSRSFRRRSRPTRSRKRHATRSSSSSRSCGRAATITAGSRRWSY